MTAPVPTVPAAVLAQILEVTRKLAAPFDLVTMLTEVVEAAKSVLDADGGSLWLYQRDSHELVMRVAKGIEPVRMSADRGIVGECVRTRSIVNVPDAYADERFNRDIDKATGYRTRCLLTLPLIGFNDELVGVLQILNKREGVFTADDETVAGALAAQCAVALQRVQMHEMLVRSAKLQQEVEVAREVQMSTLPRSMPAVAGYDLFGRFDPADETGGDTFDLVVEPDGRVFVLMGDATGHGVGPALSVTQLHAMLRVSLRLGAHLDAAYVETNNQLCEDLSEDRFITAFMGMLDPLGHEVLYHSAGQGPILHFRALTGQTELHPPTTFPLGAMPLTTTKQPRRLALAPGDILALLSDGVFECPDAQGMELGAERVAALLAEFQDLPMQELAARLHQACVAHASSGRPGGDRRRRPRQADDITIVLVRRLPA